MLLLERVPKLLLGLQNDVHLLKLGIRLVQRSLQPLPLRADGRRMTALHVEGGLRLREPPQCVDRLLLGLRALGRLLCRRVTRLLKALVQLAHLLLL